MEDVLRALQTLYTSPSNEAREEANKWLQAFQKEPEAWETANVILASPDAPAEPKLFAAQTFRTKIIYDLDQLPAEQHLPLKNTLVSAVQQAATGQRVVLRSLCLALADLLLQIPAWRNPVQSLIDTLGSDPTLVPALLEFLAVLPEEYSTNSRVSVSNEQSWRDEKAGDKVLSLLGMYFQAPGVSIGIQKQTLDTVRSWLVAGELSPYTVQASPIFSFAFSALSTDELFDNAVNALCDLIHETQEIGDNLPVIEAIVPQLITQRQRLIQAIAAEDTDRVQGYCRLFVEAGEWYAQLMLQHPTQFLPIVEAIADCAAYSELDVVSITLNFWWKLAVGLRKGGFLNDPDCQPFLGIIARLVDTIIGHLKFPEDLSCFTGQDKDEFRAFRHDIGDTLKDCCEVLGAEACLARSLAIIESETAKGPQGSWQVIEAGLFSMRAMGMKVDLQEDQVMPRIFAVIPQLPSSESKVRYAATLVVSRYTEWLSVHENLIPIMLEYVLAGFNFAQDDVAVASASALKYLCKDCSTQLVAYLPSLFEFIQQHGANLHHDDLLEISEGLAHIIAKMSVTDSINAMQTFTKPLLEGVHALSIADTPGDKAELTTAAELLERLNIYLNVNAHLSLSLPAECSSTANQVWQILDTLLQRYGNNERLAEKCCSTIRRGMTFFGSLAIPLGPAILERVTTSFASTGISGYVWIIGRMPDMLRLAASTGQDATLLQRALSAAFGATTNKLAAMLSANADPATLQDCIEDYLHVVRNLADAAPEILFASAELANALHIAVTATTLLSPQVSHDGLDTLRSILGHDLLSSHANSTSNGALKHIDQQKYATVVMQALAQPEIGGRSASVIVTRIVTDFHEDCTPTAITLMRLFGERLPEQLASWVPQAVGALPAKSIRDADRARFLQSFNTAIASRNLGGVRGAFVTLDRATRKDKERMLASTIRDR